MTWNSKVVWSEGMFLQPQHFQQQDRHVDRLLDGRLRLLADHGWGFGTLEVDNAALAIGKVQLVAARGILPDGTPFDVPHEDPAPVALDVPADLKDELIVLALPVRRAGTSDLDAGDDDTNLGRHSVREVDVPDTTLTGGQPALVQIGSLRLRLVRSRDATDAYTCLGVVRVLERRADNTVVLARGYVPPMLRAAGDPTLDGYVRELHGLLHQRGDALATRVSQPGRGGLAEVAEFLQLQSLNRFEPLFAHLAAHPLLHPERLYSACLLLAGELSAFDPTGRRPPAFPAYRHDALAETFAPLLAHLRRLLGLVIEQSAIAIELQEKRFGVRVAVLSDHELLKTASFVLAVNAQMAPETLRSRFPSQVKIGPAEKLRDLVNLQLPGISIHALPVAPRQIPFHAGFSYFELEQGGDLWRQLERSSGLAMHVAGDFPGLEMEFWAIRG